MVLDTEIIYNPFSATPSRTVHDKLMEIVSVKDFGATGLISDNATTKIQAAIDYAATDGNFNKTVFFPNGIYNVNDTITVPQGIMLKGEGSQGSNQSFGTVIRHNANGDCFYFSGEGISNAGTGGGMENFLIVKTGSYSSGTAIFIEAQSSDNRPGEMLLTNILAYGVDDGRWTRGLVVDGTAANTSGTRGVRSVHCRKCRFAEVTSINETVVLNQVSHFFAQGLQIETGDAAGIVCFRVIGAGLEQFLDPVFPVDRHDLVAHFLGHGVQRYCEINANFGTSARHHRHNTAGAQCNTTPA